MHPCQRGNVILVLVGLLSLSASCAPLSQRSAQRVQGEMKAAFEQIQAGMSQEEVLTLMGEPHLKRTVLLETSFEVWDYRSEDVARRRGILRRPPLVWLDPRYYFLKENVRYESRVSITFVQGRVVDVSLI